MDQILTEQWRPVAGYEMLYEVSDNGQMRSLDRVILSSGFRGHLCEHRRKGKAMRVPKSSAGYSCIILCKDGKEKGYSVHRLMLEAFIGPCPEGMEACHNDGDQTNNSLSNLRWDTRQSNADDRVKHDHQPKGESHASARLNEQQVLEIRARYRRTSYRNDNARELAAEYGVSRTTVVRILDRTIWKHI